MRILEHPGATEARMKMARHREQPRAKARVGLKALGMHDQSQPRLFQQILGDVAGVGQPGEKVVQARIEHVVRGIERRWIAGPQAVARCNKPGIPAGAIDD